MRDEDRVLARLGRARQQLLRPADACLVGGIAPRGTGQAGLVLVASEGELRRLARAAVLARVDRVDRDRERPEPLADLARLVASVVAQVPLRRAVVRSRRGRPPQAVGHGVPEIDDVAALAQRFHQLDRPEPLRRGLLFGAAAAASEHGQREEEEGRRASSRPDRQPEEPRDRRGGAGGGWRPPSSAERLLRGERAPADHAASEIAERLRRQPPGGRSTSGSDDHSSRAPSASEARIWPPSQLGPTPLPE